MMAQASVEQDGTGGIWLPEDGTSGRHFEVREVACSPARTSSLYVLLAGGTMDVFSTTAIASGSFSTGGCSN